MASTVYETEISCERVEGLVFRRNEGMLRPLSRVETIFSVFSRPVEKIKYTKKNKTSQFFGRISFFVLFVWDSCTVFFKDCLLVQDGCQSCPLTFDEHFSGLKNSTNRWTKERKSSKL